MKSGSYNESPNSGDNFPGQGSMSLESDHSNTSPGSGENSPGP